MGNLCGGSQTSSGLGSTNGISDLELPEVYNQIKEHFNANPKSDFIHLNFNKHFLKMALELNGSLLPSSKTGNVAPFMTEIVRQIDSLVQKKFVPI